MRRKQIAAVAGLVLVVAGCGADGNDVGGASDGFFDVTPVEEEAPTIEVVAASDGEDHDAAHDEMDGEHDAETADDVMTDDVMSDDVMTDAAHDEMAGEHDEMADEHEMAAETDVAEAAPAAGLVVHVEMTEFGYTLDRSTVPAGEPVTFHFVNAGQIEHEAMFGSAHQQEEFAQLDGHGDHGGGGHHGEIAAITVGAGASGEMTMVFDTPGEVLIGCHLEGHWEAGMVAGVEIVAA